MDSLDDFAIFVRVVDKGSFTAAAADLAISKAVVSKSVTELEKRLGARLLNRTTRKLTLTEAGSVIYRRSNAALAELADAEQEISQLTGTPRGVLRVSAPMSFTLLHLAPLLPEFLQRFPGVSLDLDLDDRVVDLVGERVDVALRIAALADSSMVARRLALCRIVLCASPGYLEKHGAPQHPSELVRHNCLTYSLLRGNQDWQFRMRQGRPIAVSVRGNLRSNNQMALKQAVLDGVGILRCPTFYIGDELADGRLVDVLGDFKIPDLSIYAIFPERKQLAPKVRAFVDFLAEKFPAEAIWDRYLRIRRGRRAGTDQKKATPVSRDG